ncbi:MAG: hypothetical protein ACRDDY_04280 [Clostridium sp.]|uniref:hypothetical protein n=1 Tax=Clostridium sp. TaxID=1506 RepID=UPI003EE6C451
MIYVQKLRELRVEKVTKENIENCYSLLAKHGWYRNFEIEKECENKFEAFSKKEKYNPIYLNCEEDLILIEDNFGDTEELICVKLESFEKNFEEKVEINNSDAIIEKFKEVYMGLNIISDEKLRVETTWKLIGGK